MRLGAGPVLDTEKSNYQKIARNNLRRFYEDLDADVAARLGAERKSDEFFFRAFGGRCCISPAGIVLDGQPETGVLGVLISMYVLHASHAPCIIEPLKSFKELPDSMPYTAAFAARTQQPIVARVEAVGQNTRRIIDAFSGKNPPAATAGDFGFLLYPLPKIALCYVFYRADEDFPASVTCLYSANADAHLPTDALADVGEYTSREILRLVAGTEI
ncbi:MAG: DUF3786 domain-containing protein [Desulfobacterales bacterium]|nr:DUF3786 domain-containing protein [Desulfobacterales bacterium]